MRFAELYGQGKCTINMHLHGHLAECIEDFGPVYSFWCFAFERMNRILGSYHVNNHHISIQLTRRFIDSKAHLSVTSQGETFTVVSTSKQVNIIIICVH